ncbi:MAG: TatD family hydrolase [Clostridiales bacterium]|nr:TatD family hydrolase [Clostridiales bacterium]
MLFDTHAHYDDERFDADRDELLASLPGSGVGYVLNVGTDIASSETSAGLAGRHGHVWAAAGIHPHAAGDAPDDFEGRLEALLDLGRVVALGEIGLDYHYDFSPRERQREVFSRQLALACSLRKPVVIHDREADGDVLDIVGAFKGELCGGALHCFLGGKDMLRSVLDLGLHVAFGGALTFRNSAGLAECAALVPADRLLIETDAPYMSPEPFRGKRNDSTRLTLVAARLAQIRGEPAEYIERITRENAKRLFGIGEEACGDAAGSQ